MTSQQPVFSSVSIDYTGPFEVKQGRNKEKNMDLCVRMQRDISGSHRIGGISEHYIVS